MGLETKFFLENRNNKTDLYIVKAIKNAEEGSEFAERVKEIKDLPEKEIIENFDLLKKEGYNALLEYLDKKIIGHIAYQQHNNKELEWHLFQCYIIPEERGKNYANYLIKKFLEEAKQKNIDKVRLGKKEKDYRGNEKMKALVRRIKTETNLKVDLETHWVYLK